VTRRKREEDGTASAARSPRRGSGSGPALSRQRFSGRRAAPTTREAAPRHRESPRPTHKERQSVLRASDGDASGKTEEGGGGAAYRGNGAGEVADKRYTSSL
jgi:hypothetical protein